jgi:hypothetical protein
VPDTIAIVPVQRSIGGIVAQCTIRESYRLDMTVTEHPIENGANISDHAYLRPREIEIEVGWDGTQGNPSDFFNQLKQLQSQRMPFTAYTDRDIIENLLVVGIATITDQRTAYSFMALVRCRQVNLVSTQSTVISPQQGQAATQFQPSTTAQNDRGTQTLLPGSAANTQSATWQSLITATPPT